MNLQECTEAIRKKVGGAMGVALRLQRVI